MVEVTKEQFYERIRKGKLDVINEPVGTYPYTEVFKFRSGKVWGKIIPSEIDSEKYPYPWYVEHYYIM